MRKLKIIEHISLDGIIQNTTDDDGFPYHDWAAARRTPEGAAAVMAVHGDSDLLIGRRTYDMWSGFWPMAPSSPMSDHVNTVTKYVVTHRPDTLEWGPAQAVGPDLVEGVRRLTAQDGPDLVVTGSSTLTSELLGNGLVDELVLVVHPVLLGTGKRLFADGTPAQSFELAGTSTTPAGVSLTTYKAAGALKPA